MFRKKLPLWKYEEVNESQVVELKEDCMKIHEEAYNFFGFKYIIQ